MRLKRNIRLYFMYISAIMKSTMEYKASFILMVIGRFLVAFNGFLGIYFLFSHFSAIGKYTYSDILMCCALIQLSFFLTECFNGFSAFSGIVRRGEFDRILLRPCSPILQVLGTRFELGRLGPMVTAAIMLAVGIRKSQIAWNGCRILAMVFMVFGGVLLFTGLFMVGAAICFFSLEESGCMNVLTFGASEHGKYPIDIYGKGIMRFCTWIIPYTLIQYYPLQYLLGKSDNWYYAFYPFGSVVFLAVCYGVWRFGMKHYQSCGS